MVLLINLTHAQFHLNPSSSSSEVQQRSRTRTLCSLCLCLSHCLPVAVSPWSQSLTGCLSLGTAVRHWSGRCSPFTSVRSSPRPRLCCAFSLRH
ncbi:hypothetical protein S83_042235 [Arachis hypogaea]